jgi:hypothetical protein
MWRKQWGEQTGCWPGLDRAHSLAQILQVHENLRSARRLFTRRIGELPLLPNFALQLHLIPDPRDSEPHFGTHPSSNVQLINGLRDGTEGARKYINKGEQ